MTNHICTSTAHPAYCSRHDRDYYPRTCQHGTGCPDCDLEAAVNAAKAALPESVNGRLEKAIELVQLGHVYIAGDHAAVKSQSSERIYEIRFGGCNCYDARHKAPTVAGKPACKHQLAVWLSKKMGQANRAPQVEIVDSPGGRITVTDGKLTGAWCRLCKKAVVPSSRRGDIVGSCGHTIALKEEFNE